MKPFSQALLVTIDSASTRDIDDAFTIQPRPGGGFDLLVAIADPSVFVPVGSADDLAAMAMAATIYVRESPSQRMLPPSISEDRASLVQGKLRDAMLLRVLLDASMRVVQFSVGFAPITVTQRLTYDEVPALIQGQSGPVASMLALASAVATELFAGRRSSGALALFDVSKRVMTDEEGRLLQMPSSGAMVGHLIIQELMILANASMAQYLASQNVPGLYRNHVPQLAAPPAADLASSLQAWIASGAADTASIAQRIQAAIGRAQYAPILGGHYGLAIPCYTHGTSPLRRYADLVNVRQLKALVQQRPFPYTQAELHEIAHSINRTLDERRDAVSESYKEALRAKTEAALRNDRLTGAPDHVLVQAIKLMAAAGTVDEALAAELHRLLDRDALTDKVADAMIAEWRTAAIWPQRLAQDFLAWVGAAPGRSMHLLLHGKQVGVFGAADIDSSGSGTHFEATCRITRDGTEFIGRASSTRKRDAEQLAVVAALADMLGCRPPASREQAPVLATSPSSANPKGSLLELVQTRGWPFPVIAHEMSGPSHAPHFSVVVTVQTPGRNFTAQGGGPSKKHAEASACEQLLGQLESFLPAAPPQPAAGAGDNPVGALQEHAQQRKAPMPVYDFRTKQSSPPIFEALVTVYDEGKSSVHSGFASSKAEAKRRAAEKAWAAINS